MRVIVKNTTDITLHV